MGGNARGSNALDLQGPSQRTLAGQVASGTYAVTLGYANTASGQSSIALGQLNNAGNTIAIAIGNSNVATGNGSVAIGQLNTAGGSFSWVRGEQGGDRSTYGKDVFATGNIAVGGDAQTGAHILRGVTVNGTSSVRLTSDGGAAAGANSIPLAVSSAYSFWGYMVSNQGGTASKQWTFSGLIRQGTSSATTNLVGSTASSAFGDAGLSTNTLTIAADTSNGAISFSVTGVTATTQHHVATVFTSEVI